jgi:hypothetical protein
MVQDFEKNLSFGFAGQRAFRCAPLVFNRFTDAVNARQGLRFFNRLERFKDKFELTGTTRARFEMLSHAAEKSVNRHAIENLLSVLVQLIKAFRAAHFHLSRLLDFLQQPSNLFRV